MIAGVKKRDDSLIAANGTPITTYGTKTIPLHLGRRRLNRTFILADVAQPILGVDVFRDQRIAVDIHGRRIFDIDTYTSVIYDIPILQHFVYIPSLLLTTNICDY